MDNIIERVRNFYETNKNLAIGLIVGLILIIGAIVYLNQRTSKISQSEFANIMDSSIAYINESKSLKEQSLSNQISTQNFNSRRSEIEEKVKDINEKLHSSEFDSEIEVDKETIQSAGNAIEGLVAVIFSSANLDSIQDEILALNIILENMKTGN